MNKVREATKEEVMGQDFMDLSKEAFIRKYGTLRYDSMQYMFYTSADEMADEHIMGPGGH
jgi:hypothetical protein